MNAPKKKLRWKRNPQETGLRSIGAGPRGYTYHDGQTEYAMVSALGGDWRGPLLGWYWSVASREGIKHKNTCQTPCATPEEAKKQAQEYVQSALANALLSDAASGPRQPL